MRDSERGAVAAGSSQARFRCPSHPSEPVWLALASRMPGTFKPLPREAAKAAQDEIERARKRAKKDQEKAADELFEFDAAWNRHKSATQSSDKAGKVEGLCKEKTCLCCDKPAVGKSKFCDVHRRAHDNIQRQALRGWKEGMSETPEVDAFKVIFGWKRQGGDETQACRVLVDYVDKFPDIAMVNRKSTRARGMLVLTKYQHAVGRSFWQVQLPVVCCGTRSCSFRRWV